jgi:predicted RNA binding protein YcfA (HicA-like mRNA interferase family)
MRLIPVHRRDFIKRLRELGWDGPHSGGSHQYMHKGSGKGAFKVMVPNPHGGGEIAVPLLRRILRQAGISPDAWINE